MPIAQGTASERPISCLSNKLDEAKKEMCEAISHLKCAFEPVLEPVPATPGQGKTTTTGPNLSLSEFELLMNSYLCFLHEKSTELHALATRSRV